MGQLYTGKVYLHYFTKSRQQQQRILFNEHIMKIKSFSNRIAMLTGKGTIIIFDIDTTSKNEDKQLDNADLIELKANSEDQVTAF